MSTDEDYTITDAVIDLHEQHMDEEENTDNSLSDSAVLDLVSVCVSLLSCAVEGIDTPPLYFTIPMLTDQFL